MTDAAAAAPPPPAAATTQPPPGLLALPGIATPDDLRSAWRRRWRPAAEARVSALALAASDDAALLAALDAALALARDAAALGAHIAARHADARWRAAAADVEDGALKYLEFLAADRALARRLEAAERRLAAAGAPGSGADGGARPQLARALRRALRRNAPAAAGATLDAGAWAAALEAPDSAQEKLRALQAAESDLLARLDALMSDPVLAPTVALRRRDLPGASGAGGGTAASMDSGSISISTSISSSGEEDERQEGAAEGGEAEGDDDAVVEVALTRAATAALLARGRSPEARAAAYASGLLPRLEAGGALLAALARARGAMARLCGAESFPELCARDLVAPGPVEVATYLQALAEALRPAADARVEALLRGVGGVGSAGGGGADDGNGDADGGKDGALDPWDFESVIERVSSWRRGKWTRP